MYDKYGKRRPESGSSSKRVPDDLPESKSGGVSRSGRSRPSFGRTFLRSLALVALLASILFFLWGLFFSGEVIFRHNICAEDVTRGFDYGPIWLQANKSYRARLDLLIPEGEVMWETEFNVLNRDKSLVEPTTVYLNTTQPEFAPGKRTLRDNYFTLKGESGWHFFRLKQVGGDYPSPGVMGAPVAGLEIRDGAMEPKVCYMVLIAGFLIGATLLVATRSL